MNDLSQMARYSIEAMIKKWGEKRDNRPQLVLYPFGEGGKIVKGILNYEYNIQEDVIVDNFLAERSNDIYDFSVLTKYPDATVLVTSYRCNVINLRIIHYK